MLQPQFTIASVGNKLILEPLPQGFGHTLGNALRRALYTSIPGAAITSVKIGSARHQFSTIEGLQEDVVQLVLNLKQIRVAYSGLEPIKITLESKGPGEIKAGDFAVPTGVEIANPKLVLAHLSDKNSKLEIVATVESGLGYSPAEERQITTVGIIPVDAIFSPVSLVNYTVEAARVGRVTNYDRLVIEIETDGTVTPQSALTTAAQILVSFFLGIINPQSQPQAEKILAAANPSAFGGNVAVEELDLPTRISNALQKAGFDTIASLISTPRAKLSKVKNLGSKSVKIIELALRERGFEYAS